jgi:hypothetical protein
MLSLKTSVNVSKARNKQKKTYRKTYPIFVGILKATAKKEKDPCKNITDPEHGDHRSHEN